MPSARRRIANFIERASGNLVVPPTELHLMHQRVHLRHFFAYFGVDCVFDVGANAGQYATMLRNDIGFTGPIISYEPIPEMLQRLHTLSAGDSNWHIEPFALDEEAGPATFHVMAESQFSSLHAPSTDQPEIFSGSNRIPRNIQVMRATLADQFPKWRQNLHFVHPFLKMDTQGNDHAVVHGAGTFIRNFVGLQSELAIQKLYADTIDFAEAIADYIDRGFALSALVPNNAGHFPTLIEIACIMYNRSASGLSHPLI